MSAVELHREGLDIKRPVQRDEFEAAIKPLVTDAEACATNAIETAGRGPGEVASVVTTGGSSLIPAFRRMLAARFPNATIRESATFTSVASGLALAGWKR